MIAPQPAERVPPLWRCAVYRLHTVYPLVDQRHPLVVYDTAADFGHAHGGLVGCHAEIEDGVVRVTGHDDVVQTAGTTAGGDRGLASARVEAEGAEVLQVQPGGAASAARGVTVRAVDVQVAACSVLQGGCRVQPVGDGIDSVGILGRAIQDARGAPVRDLVALRVDVGVVPVQ